MTLAEKLAQVNWGGGADYAEYQGYGFIGTALALTMAGLGAAGALGGAAISANAAGNAAQTQSNAAMDAAQLQYQSGQNALDFQKQVWNQQQADIAPWLQSGSGAMATMDQLLGLNAPNIPANYGQPQGSAATIPALQNISGASRYSRGIGMLNGVNSEALRVNPHNPGSAWAGNPAANPGRSATLPQTGIQAQGTARFPAGTQPTTQPGIASGQLVPFAPWTQQFVAPTADQARATPGYQFLQDQGMQAVQNSAAARGDLLSGNTLTDLNKFGQGLADTTYNETYNRALGQYQQNYNIYENNQANQWNRLAGLAGLGQTAVGQLNSAGSNAAGNTSNILLGTGANIGRDIQNSAAATASGYVGAANAWGGALGGIGSLAMLAPFANMMNNGGMMGSNQGIGNPYAFLA